MKRFGRLVVCALARARTALAAFAEGLSVRGRLSYGQYAGESLHAAGDGRTSGVFAPLLLPLLLAPLYAAIRKTKRAKKRE